MGSNNGKYSAEMREQTAQYIVESGKSASRMAEELNIDKNTVCKWVREYRRKKGLPSYAQSKGIKAGAPKSEQELALRNKELESELKKQKKQLAEEREKIEILKKSLHIFMQSTE